MTNLTLFLYRTMNPVLNFKYMSMMKSIPKAVSNHSNQLVKVRSSEKASVTGSKKAT
eukprot:jgi/Pico_ML_1/54775/g640.t1